MSRWPDYYHEQRAEREAGKNLLPDEWAQHLRPAGDDTMSTNGNGTQEQYAEALKDWPLPEAGASWTVKYHSANGFDCMLTLRGHDGSDLIPKVQAAEKWLTEHGAQPAINGHTNSNRSVPVPFEAPICNLHNKPMKKSKFDGWICTAKLADGSYCDQKQD